MPPRLSFLHAALLGALLFSGCQKSPDSAGGAMGEETIAVIPKGTTHAHWKSVEKGARQAGEELHVKIEWKGPLKESDRAQQIAIVEQFASEGVSGIVVAPLDDAALRRPIAGAMAKNIPVVIIDSALQGEAGKDFLGFVGTNNKQGGVMAGEELARLLGGKGKVVLLRYAEGSAATLEREAGFMEVMHKNPGITMLLENRYGGATATEAQTTALNIIDQLREADGIFCSNESLTFGMLLALRQNNLIGKAKFVGFDSSGPLIEAMGKGEINALVAQNPVKMGYEAVKMLVAHLHGEKTPESIDSGALLITPENLKSAEVQALLGSK